MAKVLDKGGIILALFFGIILFVFGGPNYLALMLVFFTLAIGATRYEHEIKRSLGLYEHERGWENVLSNGILPAVLAVLSASLGPIPFICSLAAITADKFGSEIGVLAMGEPTSLFTFKPVKPGTSGAMSVMGTAASLAGSASIAAAALFLFKISPNQALLVASAGFLGCIADSILGYFEERGIGTKETTNFACSLVGALIGLLLK
ncbi:DUF92 domain-containing protein [Candidatus Micrarchaeota archaeon]|nr:DUF92 domain-containing protein [Candidatus Micrarchaeota archaeon]